MIVLYPNPTCFSGWIYLLTSLRNILFWHFTWHNLGPTQRDHLAKEYHVKCLSNSTLLESSQVLGSLYVRGINSIGPRSLQIFTGVTTNFHPFSLIFIIIVGIGPSPKNQAFDTMLTHGTLEIQLTSWHLWRTFQSTHGSPTPHPLNCYPCKVCETAMRTYIWESSIRLNMYQSY